MTGHHLVRRELCRGQSRRSDVVTISTSDLVITTPTKDCVHRCTAGQVYRCRIPPRTICEMLTPSRAILSFRRSGHCRYQAQPDSLNRGHRERLANSQAIPLIMAFPQSWSSSSSPSSRFQFSFASTVRCVTHYRNPGSETNPVFTARTNEDTESVDEADSANHSLNLAAGRDSSITVWTVTVITNTPPVAY